MVSSERYMPWMDWLTYTIERHVAALPCRVRVVISAKKAPSIAIGERLAAERDGDEVITWESLREVVRQ